MMWGFAIAVVTLLAIIVQLLLVFQKRAHQLRIRQEPLRRRIREHLRSMRDATVKVRQTAARQTEEMRFAIDSLREQSDVLSRAIAGLEEAERPEVEAPQPAAEGQTAPAQEPAEGQEGAREKVRHLRRQHEEIGGHLTSMRRELEIVRRCMARMEAKMQRRMPKGAEREVE